MRLSCYWRWISSQHCQSSLRIHSAIAPWIHSYFDNVMTTFMTINLDRRIKNWRQFVNSFAALTRAISSWTLEDKIHIHARACNILYVSNACSWNNCSLRDVEFVNHSNWARNTIINALDWMSVKIKQNSRLKNRFCSYTLPFWRPR